MTAIQKIPEPEKQPGRCAAEFIDGRVGACRAAIEAGDTQFFINDGPALNQTDGAGWAGANAVADAGANRDIHLRA